MKIKSSDIYFWQRIVTPHMANIAASMVKNGYAVTYVAECLLSEGRTKQGWQPIEMEGVNLRIIADGARIDKIISEAASDSIHICQGIRGNGLVALAQKYLRKRGLKHWVVMETVNDQGAIGFIKRTHYKFLFWRHRNHLHGVLANGWKTSAWVSARGVPHYKIFPFAYFLSEAASYDNRKQRKSTSFRFLFVGEFSENKQLGLLIDALSAIPSENYMDFNLHVIGSGPLEKDLRNRAQKVLGSRLEWIGRLPMEEVRLAMLTADCLVLPSRHDGWGAVVSEALMAGTPAIVSDTCGSAGVVKASGVGGIFPARETSALQALLQEALGKGKIIPEKRLQLAHWAKCLGADAGATYLHKILQHSKGVGARPSPPWMAMALGEVE